MGVQTLTASTAKVVKAPKPVSEARRIRKPLMERKRRERINTSLNDLSALLTEARLVKSEGAGRPAKLEKADILELTVRHIRSLKAAPSDAESNKETEDEQKENSGSLGKYRDGFVRCMTLVEQTLKKAGKEALKDRLLTHLSSCLLNLPPTSVDSKGADEATTAELQNSLVVTESSGEKASSPPTKVKPEPQQTAVKAEGSVSAEEGAEATEKSATNKESAPRKLTLTPTRLPSGAVAFIIQGGLDPSLLLPSHLQEGEAPPPTPAQAPSPAPALPTCAAPLNSAPTCVSPPDSAPTTEMPPTPSSPRPPTPSLPQPIPPQPALAPCPSERIPSPVTIHHPSTPSPITTTCYTTTPNTTTTHNQFPTIHTTTFQHLATPPEPYQQPTTSQYQQTTSPITIHNQYPTSTPSTDIYQEPSETSYTILTSANPSQDTDRMSYTSSPAHFPHSSFHPSSSHPQDTVPPTSAAPEGSSYSPPPPVSYHYHYTHQHHPVHSPPTPPPSVSPLAFHLPYHMQVVAGDGEVMEVDGERYYMEESVDVDIEEEDEPFDLSMRKMWRPW